MWVLRWKFFSVPGHRGEWSHFYHGAREIFIDEENATKS